MVELLTLSVALDFVLSGHNPPERATLLLTHAAWQVTQRSALSTRRCWQGASPRP